MTGDCCRPARRRPLGIAVAGGLLAALVPKCPLCLAASLSLLGGAAAGAVWLRPVGVAMALAGVAVYLLRTFSSRRSSTRVS
jgi:hypothetical protein